MSIVAWWMVSWYYILHDYVLIPGESVTRRVELKNGPVPVQDVVLGDRGDSRSYGIKFHSSQHTTVQVRLSQYVCRL